MFYMMKVRTRITTYDLLFVATAILLELVFDLKKTKNKKKTIAQKHKKIKDPVF